MTEDTATSATGPARRRRLGQYYQSGRWDDYWQTAVSHVGPNQLLIRGYPVEEVITHLTFAETLFLTVRGELPTRSESRVLDAILCCIPAHQWVASHLLAAAVTASANPESPIPGIASGVLSMGSVTVSPQETAHLIDEGMALIADGASMQEAAEKVVDTRMAASQLIPGLGHPNHKDHDPRSTALAEVAKAEGIWGQATQFYEEVRATFARKSGKDLPINIDGMMASIMTEMGFSPLEMAGIAAVAAMPGLVAHVVEEITSGVPLRIVPDELGSRYIGPPERHIPGARSA